MHEDESRRARHKRQTEDGRNGAAANGKSPGLSARHDFDRAQPRCHPFRRPNRLDAAVILAPSRRASMKRLACFLLPLLLHCQSGSAMIVSGANFSLINMRDSVYHINESMFSHSRDTLQEFHCNFCNISEIDDDAFSGFGRLEMFDLRANTLTKLNGYWFKDMENLTVVDVRFNNLTRCVNIDMLLNLTNLQGVYITGNPNLDRSCHDAIRRFNEKNVTCAKLSEGTYSCKSIRLNDIEMLPDNIVHLKISNTLVKTIDASVFSRFAPTLKYFLCYNCRIWAIEFKALSGFSRLRTLDLENNIIYKVAAGSFKNNANLETLDLRNNVIVDIEGAVFDELPNLKWLHLSRNNLNCLEIEKLLPLRKQVKLDIYYNPNLSDICVAMLRKKGFKVEVEIWKWFKSYFF